MKNILLAFTTALCLVGISQAAAIKWSVGNAAIKGFTVEGGTITPTTSNLAGANLYFYLGALTTSDVESAFTSTGFDYSKTSTGTYLESAVSTAGGSKSAGQTPVVNDGISNTAANQFSLVIASQYDTKWYYKVVSGSAVGYDNTNLQDPAKTMTFTATDVSGSSWAAAPAVPEPATGALALAGIALLLKRRKAAKA